MRSAKIFLKLYKKINQIKELKFVKKDCENYENTEILKNTYYPKFYPSQHDNFCIFKDKELQMFIVC